MNAKPKINQKISQFGPVAGPSAGCPLQHIRAFMGLSPRRPGLHDVRQLIDTRQIRWAWDIARPGARRPEVRIWRDSLLACLARESGAPAPPPDNRPIARIIEALMPRPAAMVPRATGIRFQEVERLLMCSRTHLRGLIKDGELCLLARPTRGRSPLVLQQSVVEFLTRRSLSI